MAKTVSITWNWGSNAQLDFDPKVDKLDFSWMGSSNFTVAEVSGNTVITINGNSQSYTLKGVTLHDLHMTNIAANDSSAVTTWQALLNLDPPPKPPEPPKPVPPEPPTPVVDDHVLTVKWDYGKNDMVMFNAATDKIDLGWLTKDQFSFTQMDGMLIINVTDNNHSYMLHGAMLSDLHASNFIVKDAGAAAYVSDVIDEKISVPDQPHPPTTNENPGTTENPFGGTDFYITSTGGADITTFNVATDRLDFGVFSVHAFIMVDTPEGVGFRSPWNSDVLVIKGVHLDDLTVNNFTTIGNAHLREDVSGALAWEHGIDEQPHHVYARSHEVGQVDKVAFDPTTDVVDFSYFGTRELVQMYDSYEGVVITNTATNQQLILSGVKIADLSADNFLFHFSQVREDHLDTQLGFQKMGWVVDDAHIVSRADIPTAGVFTEDVPHHHDDGMVMAMSNDVAALFADWGGSDSSHAGVGGASYTEVHLPDTSHVPLVDAGVYV